LTLLCIASVILLTSIGEGIHRFVLAEFTQFGTNIASISPGKVKTSGPAPTGIPSSVRPLTLDDARAFVVLEAKGQFLGVDLDDSAYIPSARALELYNRDGMMKIDLAYEE
jgi:hypothetical protein